ncbi:MAG: Tad domain-containing protein [Bacillota bacterium]
MSAGWDKRGSVSVLLAVALSALLASSALVIDVGKVYAKRQELSNIADAAALAGVQYLPESPELATDAAIDYAARNGIPSDRVRVLLSDNHERIQVLVNGVASMTIARVFGRTEEEVYGSSTAEVAVPTAMRGLVPLGVEAFNFVYGTTYILKCTPDEGGSKQGNFQALALGFPGAKQYKSNLKYGYAEPISLGQYVHTETGNISGPTVEALNWRLSLDPYATFDTVRSRSPRILLVPLVNSFDVNGKKTVQIVGFAAFFMEEVSQSGAVKGRFMRIATEADMTASFGAAPDYGLRTYRLVR